MSNEVNVSQSHVNNVSFHCPFPVHEMFLCVSPSSKRRPPRQLYDTILPYGCGALMTGYCMPFNGNDSASQNTATTLGTIFRTSVSHSITWIWSATANLTPTKFSLNGVQRNAKFEIKRFIFVTLVTSYSYTF